MQPKSKFFDACLNGGQQHVRVEHVHIDDDGQAVICNVEGRISDSRADGEKENSSP
jgi:hypothetical protein